MLQRIQMVLVVMIALLCCNRQPFGIKLTLESFEQTLGQDVMWLNLRVRKYNRTCSVLNGTIHVLQEFTNDYQVQLDLFYSRLGNQQFNHMPMKLPTAGICNFFDYMYQNYQEHMTIMVNGPAKGECPMKIRDIYIYDKEFPTEVLPPSLLRNGLWKALVSCYLYGKETISYSLVLKAADD